ncbi:uncharacterized protein OCT59_020433 [Rhizophagus irregularis]|uniref:uncharacterized protein n=1 Tax=Rhizophagus irregularis TaxID=588596 RepID=UPI0033330262|nr:hypothetical protein OCT59_020433 [Rhizophagus irregularis]
MDLDSNAYYKLCLPDRDNKYNKILKAIQLLQHKYDHETPEMWCSHNLHRYYPKVFTFLQVLCDLCCFGYVDLLFLSRKVSDFFQKLTQDSESRFNQISIK